MFVVKNCGKHSDTDVLFPPSGVKTSPSPREGRKGRGRHVTDLVPHDATALPPSLQCLFSTHAWDFTGGGCFLGPVPGTMKASGSAKA